MTAGGYQIKVPAGSYTVTASGGGLSGPMVSSVTVGGSNEKVDFESSSVPVAKRWLGEPNRSPRSSMPSRLARHKFGPSGPVTAGPFVRASRQRITSSATRLAKSKFSSRILSSPSSMINVSCPPDPEGLAANWNAAKLANPKAETSS